MFKNYVKIALRNLRNQAGYAFINIGGLGLGLTCSFLIVLFVQHELSYDRFHDHADRIYRLIPAWNDGERQASSASGFAPDLMAAFPEIDTAVRVENFRSPYLKVGGENRIADGFAFADPAFFDVFTFPLRRGNPETALERPDAVVLTESAAQGLFGDEDPLGRVITFNDDLDLTVTGIMQDVPPNSHLQFNYLGSFKLMTQLMGEDALREYTNYNYTTYLMLKPGVDPAGLEQKFPDFVRSTLGPETNLRLALQPLTDIHFTTDIRYDVGTNRDIRYLYLFAAIAVFILLIACINFMNLSTARAAKRSKEVGVRKVVGAGRRQLIGQFLGESVMLSLLAIALALTLTALLLPVFNDLIGGNVRLGTDSLGVVALLLGIGLGAGLVAGSYPAFYLSAFQPALVLKGEGAGSRRAALLRKGLIVVQFSISVFLIVGTLVVYSQLQYMKEQQLGFDKEQVVFATPAPPIRENFDAFKQQLLANPRVLSVAQAGHLPGRVGTVRGYNWPGQSTEEEQGQSFYTIIASPDYLETLGLKLVAGRTFSHDIASDADDTYLLNETAVRALGWEDPVGHPFRVWDREMGRVIGVVEDFHFKSLHQQIEPVVLNMKPSWYGYVVMRLAPEDIAETLQHLQAQWKTFAPDFAFDYRFLDEDFDRLYRAEEQLAERFGFFALIAIGIACLGLFGLAAYTAEQRTKEIGIRKVLGASVTSIVALLSKDFLRLVLVAFLVAAPAAYLAMQHWLRDFAYRIEIGPGLFLLAGGIALVIALGTVLYQSIRAAVADPVKSLRYE